MLYSSFETQSFIYSCGESLPPEQTNKQELSDNFSRVSNAIKFSYCTAPWSDSQKKKKKKKERQFYNFPLFSTSIMSKQWRNEMEGGIISDPGGEKKKHYGFK